MLGRIEKVLQMEDMRKNLLATGRRDLLTDLLLFALTAVGCFLLLGLLFRLLDRRGKGLSYDGPCLSGQVKRFFGLLGGGGIPFAGKDGYEPSIDLLYGCFHMLGFIICWQGFPPARRSGRPAS